MLYSGYVGLLTQRIMNNENGIIPPPTGDGTGPGPSAALLPCRSKAQELRAKVLKQPALLNARQGKRADRLWVPMGRSHRPPGALLSTI